MICALLDTLFACHIPLRLHLKYFIRYGGGYQSMLNLLAVGRIGGNFLQLVLVFERDQIHSVGWRIPISGHFKLGIWFFTMKYIFECVTSCGMPPWGSSWKTGFHQGFQLSGAGLVPTYFWSRIWFQVWPWCPKPEQSHCKKHLEEMNQLLILQHPKWPNL